MRVRQYPPLNQGQKLLNVNELNEIRALFISSYEDRPELLRKLDHLLTISHDVLASSGIVMSIPAGIESFKVLLHTALLQADDRQFKGALLDWVEDYKALEDKASVNNKNLIQQFSPGIIGCLNSLNGYEKQAQGDQFDFNLLFKGLIVDPDQVKGAGTFTLTPVPISAGPYSSEEERRAPHIFIQNHIQSVLSNNPDKTIHLLIPVNAGQNHWMATKVILQHGKIVSANLYDSIKIIKGADNEHEKLLIEARKNLQKAVNVINKDNSVSADAFSQKNQHDSFRCMDYAAQKILKLLPDDVVQANDLTHVRDAKSGENLRTAVIAKIKRNHPQLGLNRIQDVKVREDARQLFSPQTFTPQVKRNIEHALEAVSCAKESATRDLQIQFDEVLANHLQALYRNPAGRAENTFFDIAFKQTFVHFHKTFGFFKPGNMALEDAKETPVPTFSLKNSN